MLKSSNVIYIFPPIEIAKTPMSIGSTFKIIENVLDEIDFEPIFSKNTTKS